MFPLRRIITVAALTVFSQPLLADNQQVIAEINGTTISQQQLINYAQARQSQGVELPTDMLLGELINRELINQDAASKKLDQEQPFVATLKEQQNNLLAAYALQKVISSSEITEELLRAEYENIKDTLSESEYLASHILLEEKAQAEAIIADLNNGADFAEMAKEKSVHWTTGNLARCHSRSNGFRRTS